LDDCDVALTSQGLDSIYPDIFSREPVPDTVKLQTMLFSMQYACAKSWMDCGLLEDTAFRAMGNELQMIVTQCRSIEIRSFSDVFLCVYC
jgi:hypothetical protein